LVQEIFKANKTETLHGLIVWIPMRETDHLEAANEREIEFSDPRVKQFWDEDRIFGQLLWQTLHLKESIACDVYLVYLPDHFWDTTFPPMPAFWMHQQNEEPSLFMNPAHLKEYVSMALERTIFHD
jgi:hypothetical protein